MSRKRIRYLVLGMTIVSFCTLVGILATPGYAIFSPALQDQEDQEKQALDQDEKPKAKKPETVEIESKPILVYRSFEGRFESTRMSEVKTEFKTWTDLEIREIVEQGAVVRAGEEVLVFETEKLDKAISEAEFAFHNAELAVADSELELKEVTETFELEKTIIARTWKDAKEDHDYYLNVSAPERLKDLDFDEKSSGYRLEYSKDELDQLEQMYTEDELTEESEEIVLKRARRSVESAERFLNRTTLRLKRERDTAIPRDNLKVENEFKRAALEFGKASIKLPIKKQRAEISLAKARFDLQDKQKNLAELIADRKRIALKSPVDGTLYYGKCVRGNWVGASGTSTRRLEPGKKVSANKVVMTIVDVDTMMIRSDLAESELESLSPGMNGKAIINSTMNTTIPVSIKSIARIPLDNGKFDCQLVATDLNNVQVMPGMTCKLNFMIYENENAVVAPSASVFSDDGGLTNYVYIVKGGGSTKTPVVIGRKAGDNVEVLKGVSAGEKILKSKP